MRIFSRRHELLLKYIAEIGTDYAETRDNLFEVDSLWVYISKLHIGTLLLDIYKPAFWHLEVCLSVPMDTYRQPSQTHKYKCVAVDENTYCRTVLQGQKELEQVLIKDETWDQGQQKSHDQSAYNLIIRMHPFEHSTESDNIDRYEQEVHDQQ